MKKLLITLACIAALKAGYSQTLFTYGPHKAAKADFLRAFNKNYQAQPGVSRAKAMEDYLQLYIASRQKVEEAIDRGYDTLPQLKQEMAMLREQILEKYINDPAATDKIVNEAFERSLKDIHAAHIFIAWVEKSGVPDTAATRQKLNAVLGRLTKGEDFLQVAQQLSDDPSARQNKGDLNYITVFSLPYEFENLIYTTVPGRYSKPYASRAGYHIFKNISERKAAGKIKTKQVLLAIPPGADAATRQQTAALADSLYQLLKKGEDIGRLAALYSNDTYSMHASGSIPDIGVGQFDPLFEKTVWALKDGETSKPLLTTHGYHILQRVAAIPVVTNPADADNKEMLRMQAEADSRWASAKDFIYAAVKKKAGFKKANYTDKALWAISDSLLDYKNSGMAYTLTPQSLLFTIGDSSYRISNWITYAQMHRYRPDYSGVKTYPELMDEYSKHALYGYYRDHLEQFNDSFRQQMEEFKEGNLFFEIMQREVWTPSQTDTMALRNVYEKNKTKYQWTQSADAALFFSADTLQIKEVAAKVKQQPASWRSIVAAYPQVVADSGRYEWTQLPLITKKIPQAGDITPVAVNATDQTALFACIFAVHTQPSQRSFEEARGLVISDYQEELDAAWRKKLSEKYPVSIDKKIWELTKSGR